MLFGFAGSDRDEDRCEERSPGWSFGGGDDRRDNDKQRKRDSWSGDDFFDFLLFNGDDD